MHLQRLPSGHWRAQVKHRGVVRWTSVQPSEALARLRGAQLEIEFGGTKRRGDSVTVGELLDAHLATVDWSPTTRIDSLAVATALPATFRARNVAEVDAADIAALYRSLARAGWSAHRIHRLRMVLSTAWSTAISHRWAAHNPVRDAKAPKLPAREITPPTAGQVAAILAAAKPAFLTFLRLAAATGLRRGELVALQWRDFSDDYRSVRVRRSLVHTVEGRAERDTKTSVKGHRGLRLGPSVAAALAEHHAAQCSHAGEVGSPEPVWVFSHNSGETPWRPDYTSREFAHTRRRAGIEGVRLHDVRHHVATTLLDDGVAVHKVSRQVGHASTATTLRVYAHWIDDADDDIARRLDR